MNSRNFQKPNLCLSMLFMLSAATRFHSHPILRSQVHQLLLQKQMVEKRIRDQRRISIGTRPSANATCAKRQRVLPSKPEYRRSRQPRKRKSPTKQYHQLVRSISIHSATPCSTKLQQVLKIINLNLCCSQNLSVYFNLRA